MRNRLWIIPVILAGACFIAWLLKMAMFNYWAAGGPPTKFKEVYEARGNLFLAGAATVTVLLVVLYRYRK
jgi:hypothetical protein